jgi:iron complex outermembrane receptor protein
MALGTNGQAFAADQPTASNPSKVGEVVVTSERRSTDIQKTPQPITAVTSVALDKSFTTLISDLSATVPSLEITKTAGTENLVTIRGVGSETPENTQTTSPGVSTFIDGVYLVSSAALNETLFDVDHVEVLRGPQGDLFGESSIGGAINIVTKAPQLNVYSFNGDVSGGTYDLYRVRAAANIPLGDDWALRLSFQKYAHEGFAVDTNPNLLGYREDDADDISGKASLLWKPTDYFSAQLTGEWYQSWTNGAEQKNIDPAADPDIDPREFDQDFPNKYDLTHQLYHLNLTWDMPYFSVKSVTGYEYLYADIKEDSSRSSYAALGSYDDVALWTDDVHSYTEELDILSKPGSRLEWIAGAFGIYEHANSPTAEFEGPANACAVDPGPIADPSEVIPAPDIATAMPFPCNLAYGNISTNIKRGAAGFIRLTYHVTDNLRVSAGARYNWDSSSNDSYNFSEYGDSTAAYKFSTSLPTYRFEADYNITPVNMLYASYARGYKPGGVNGSPCIGSACPQVVQNTFQPEINDGFELGLKNSFFDGKLLFNVDGFLYNHYNFQYIEQDPVPFDDGMSNIPHVRDYGAEFEAHYRGMDSKFHVDGTLTLEKGEVVGKYLTIDSTVSNALEGPDYSGNNELATFGPCAYGGAYYNPACWAQVESAAINIQGKSPPAEPNVAGAISASYDFDLGESVLTPWVQFVYRGAEWARIFNDPNLDRVPSYGVVNLNLSLVPGWDRRLKFTLSATNVGNVAGINSQYTDPYGTAQTSREYIAPRQVIGTIAFAY